MILYRRFLSHRSGCPTGVALAAVTFVAGLAIGSAIGPVTASRGSEPAIAAPAPERLPPRAETGPLRAAHPVDVLRVLDGDTFEARVHLWPGLDVTTKVRLRGIDAPELKARCGEERVKAETARLALKAMLDQGDVGISRVTLDKYGGRVLAEASSRATPDVSASLLDGGHVRRYAGARRETWCP